MQSSQHELAGLGQRFLALVIDGIILGIVAGILSAIFSRTSVVQTDQGVQVVANGPGPFLGFLVALAYYWFCYTRRAGQTIGKQIMGVRVVRVDGQPLTFMTALLRYLGYFLNSFVIMIGWIWAIFDSKKQGWHDKIAGTIVIKA